MLENFNDNEHANHSRLCLMIKLSILLTLNDPHDA